jgi:hypothetical protein
MDQFHSLLPDRVYAHQQHVLPPEEQLQKAVQVSNNPAACVSEIGRAPDDVFRAFALERFFGFARTFRRAV